MTVPMETVQALAPVIAFHADEQYLPCTIEHLMDGGALKDPSPTQIAGQTTSYPAMTSLRDQLWMVYSDSHSSQLWVTSSSDGLNWDDASQIVDQHQTGSDSWPAIGTFGDKLWIAYTNSAQGGWSDIVISWSSDGRNWSTPAKTNLQTPWPAPAICEFRERLWMAYTDGNKQIYVASSADGLRWSEPTEIGQQTAVPALCAYDGRLWMTYTDSDRSDIWVTVSSDGTTWIDTHKIDQSSDKLSLAVFTNRLFMAYSDSSNSDMWVTSTTDGHSWDTHQVEGQHTTVLTPIVGLGGFLCMLYVDSNHSQQLWATRSLDGVTWTRPPISPVTQQVLLEYPGDDRYLDISESQYPGESLEAPMYYAVQEFSDHTEITYLILCAFNGPQTVNVTFLDLICMLAQFARHPGDLERVTVAFANSPRGPVVTSITVESHGDPAVIEAADILFDGTHPCVLSSLNAHGTFSARSSDWVVKDAVAGVEFGDALGTYGDSKPNPQVWTPREYRLVGLDSSGNPIGDQVWSKFAGRLGDHVSNSLTDGRHFDGSGLSAGDWAIIEALAWGAGVLGKITSDMESGDGPKGLANRAYIRPAPPYGADSFQTE